jgi:hypothetical protein
MIRLITTTFFLFVCFSLQAQNAKLDKLTYASGKVVEGTVIELDDEKMVFRADGSPDTLIIPRGDLKMVLYTNGKSQMFKSEGPKVKVSTTPEERKGIIAVLPFEIKNTEFEGYDPEMSVAVQNDCVDLFKKYATGYTIQHPDTTMARIRRAGVTVANVTEILPADMAQMLGAQFVSYGSVWIAQNTSSEGDENYFESENATADDPQAARSNPSLAAKKFQTIVDLNVYDDMGEMAFTKVQESFWAVSDAYKQNLEAIISKSPFIPGAK